MRRIIAILLAICLLPIAALAEDAAVQPNLDGTSPSGLFVMDDQLYALVSWRGLYKQVEGGWLPALEFMGESSSIECLSGAQLDNSLYFFTRSYADGEVYAIHKTTLTDGAFSPLEKVCDVDPGFGEDVYPQLYGMTVDESSAYLLIYTDQTGINWGSNDLLRISLPDGAVSKLTTNYFSELIPFGDKLLTRYWNQMEAYTEDGITMPSLAEIDKATGEYTILCDLPSTGCGALATDGDHLYAADNSHLYRYDSTFGAPVLCAYLAPGGGRDGAAAAVYQDQYFVGDWSSASGITTANTDPALLPTRILRMTSPYGDDQVLRDFCAAYPDIAVEIADTYPAMAEEISQQMVSGSEALDIYCLFLVNGAYEPLYRKGYCYDLSSSTALTATLDSMYPFAQNVLRPDGKLYAIPCYISASTMGYYPSALEKAGLTADDMPTTIMELLDFVETWYYDYAEEYPEMMLFEYAYSLYEQLLNLIFEQQMYACEAAGEPLTLDTPVFKQLLQRLEQLKPILTEMEPETNSDGSISYISMYGDTGMNCIFTTYADLLPSRYGGNSPEYDPVAMPLTLEEGGEPVLTMDMAAYIVNPASKNIDIATLFLEFAAQHMAHDAKVVLMPEFNEQLEYEYYQQNKESLQESLTTTKAMLAEAPAEEKSMWEEQISWIEEYLLQIEDERWAISDEDIAAYRAIADSFMISTGSFYSQSSTELSSLLQRYLDGQITVDQLIKDFSRITRMIELESQ